MKDEQAALTGFKRVNPRKHEKRRGKFLLLFSAKRRKSIEMLIVIASLFPKT